MSNALLTILAAGIPVPTPVSTSRATTWRTLGVVTGTGNQDFEAAFTTRNGGAGTGGSATVSRSNDWSAHGNYSRKIVSTGNNASAFYVWGDTGVPSMANAGIIPGETYTVSVTIHVPQVQTGTLSGSARAMTISQTVGGVTTDLTKPTSAKADNVVGTTRLVWPGVTVDPATTGISLRLFNGSPTAGETVYYDDLQLELGITDGTWLGGGAAPTPVATSRSTTWNVEVNATSTVTTARATTWNTEGVVTGSGSDDYEGAFTTLNGGAGTGGSAVVSRSSEWASHGNYSRKIVPAGNNASAWYAWGNTGALAMAAANLTPGQTYTASVTVYLPQVQTGSLSLSARSILLTVAGGASAGDLVKSASATAPNAVGTYRLVQQFTVPADATGLAARWFNGSLNDTEPIYYDDAQLELGLTDGVWLGGGTAPTPVTTARSTSWAVQVDLASVTASRATTWAVRATVAANRSTSWVSRAALTGNRSTTWASAATVAVARSTTWAARSAVTATRSTTWAATSTVTVSRTSTWNADALATVATSRSTTWAALQTITRGTGTSWVTRQAVTALRATTWSALTSASTARATTWVARAAAVSSRSTTWAALAPVTANRATSWTAATVVAASRSTTWQAASTVTAARIATWSATTAVTTARATTWSTTATVTASRATLWAADARITATRTASWNTDATGSVSATRSTSWAVAATVTASRGTTWAVAGTISTVAATRSTTWATRAAVTASRSSTWTVAAQVVASRSTTWAASVTITSGRVALWAVTSQVASSRDTTWRTDQRITVASTAIWATLAAVAAARNTSWAVSDTAAVETTRATVWAVHATVTAGRLTRWRVDVIIAQHVYRPDLTPTTRPNGGQTQRHADHTYRPESGKTERTHAVTTRP